MYSKHTYCFVLGQCLSDNNQEQGNSEKLGCYVQQISFRQNLYFFHKRRMPLMLLPAPPETTPLTNLQLQAVKI
jgi:hypothetical protein